MSSNLVGPIVSVLTGGEFAAASVVGLITAQTSAPSESPADANAPSIDYGTTTE